MNVKMNKIIVLIVSLIFGMALSFGIRETIKYFINYDAKQNAKAAERQAERDSLILTEKEMDFWTEVYSAGVKRGVWDPGRRANDAIIELRKMNGVQK